MKNSRTLSRALRHNQKLKLGKYLEASVEQLDDATSLRPFSWEPRKFFAFLMANSKGRFQTWISPLACSFNRFLDWDFSVGISATQGHSRMPEQVADIAQAERLTAQRASELGFIFRASENHNYECIKRDGLRPIRDHGHELFLTDNGVVLCYNDVAPMYLTFHYRPPHEQDPGGLKHEEKQRAAGVSSSFEEATPSAAADSSGATGGSPSGEVPTGTRDHAKEEGEGKRLYGCWVITNRRLSLWRGTYGR